MNTTAVSVLNMQVASNEHLDTLLRDLNQPTPIFAPKTGSWFERTEDIDILVCGRQDFLEACRLIESERQLGYMSGHFISREAIAIAMQRPWV